MAMPEQCRFISLNEIDENIISNIRDVNEHSDSFRILTNSIRADHQRHPITLRKLTEDELHRAKSGAIYGIIDGHHRFRVALKLNQTHISAIVVNSTKPDFLQDLKLALRLNESSLKMSLIEKGKVIYEIAKSTGREPICLAEELFGIKTSMAYRCLNAYKKSIGERVISKPRKTVDFEIKHLKSAWKPISKLKELPINAEDCISCLNDVIAFEKELKKYKRFLLALNESTQLTR